MCENKQHNLGVTVVGSLPPEGEGWQLEGAITPVGYQLPQNPVQEITGMVSNAVEGTFPIAWTEEEKARRKAYFDGVQQLLASRRR